jgi:hypothetical protein
VSGVCVWGEKYFFSCLSNAHFTIIYTTYKYYTYTLYTCESAFFFLEHKLHTAPSAFTYYIRKSLAIKSERERERDVSLVVCSLVKLWIPTIHRSYKFTDYKLAVEFGWSVGRFFSGNKTQPCAWSLFLLFAYKDTYFLPFINFVIAYFYKRHAHV